MLAKLKGWWSCPVLFDRTAFAPCPWVSLLMNGSAGTGTESASHLPDFSDNHSLNGSPWLRRGFSKPTSWPALLPSWLGCGCGCGPQPGGLRLQCKHIMSIFTSAWSQSLPSHLLPPAGARDRPEEENQGQVQRPQLDTLPSQASVSPLQNDMAETINSHFHAAAIVQ